MKHRHVLTICLSALLAILVAAGVLRWMQKRAYARVTPPAEVTSFESFMGWCQSIKGFETLRLNSTEYLMVTSTDGYSFVGNAGYIFDRRGSMVEWSADINDDSRFQQKWEPVNNRMTIEEAKAWLRSE